jgi:hypothetical protein
VDEEGEFTLIESEDTESEETTLKRF